MNLRAVAALAIPFFVTFSALASSDKGDGAQPSSTPTTLLDETLHILHLKHTPKPKAQPLHHGLELALDVSPDQIRLSTDHEIKVTVTVYNRSQKNAAHLDFPTSQRIEILVKDTSGKVVNTWSQDQLFTGDPASVTINPGERLVYNANVATREMTPGHPYVVEVSFPSYPELTVSRQVNPAK